jgi:hypothetical protein
MSTKRHEFADDRPLIYKLFKNVKIFEMMKMTKKAEVAIKFIPSVKVFLG